MCPGTLFQEHVRPAGYTVGLPIYRRPADELRLADIQVLDERHWLRGYNDEAPDAGYPLHHHVLKGPDALYDGMVVVWKNTVLAHRWAYGTVRGADGRWTVDDGCTMGTLRYAPALGCWICGCLVELEAAR